MTGQPDGDDDERAPAPPSPPGRAPARWGIQAGPALQPTPGGRVPPEPLPGANTHPAQSPAGGGHAPLPHIRRGPHPCLKKFRPAALISHNYPSLHPRPARPPLFTLEPTKSQQLGEIFNTFRYHSLIHLNHVTPYGVIADIVQLLEDCEGLRPGPSREPF